MSDPVTSQGDRDALIEYAARKLWGGGEPTLHDLKLVGQILDALLALPDVLLRVLLDAQKPCETCGGDGIDHSETAVARFARTTGTLSACPSCHGSGSVPLVDALAIIKRLADATKPCERCDGRGWRLVEVDQGMGWETVSDPCLLCHGSGVVPLLDREQVLAALGMGGVVQENDDLHADLVKCLEVRGLALEEAATFVQPGPDGQDYIDRGRMIRRWLEVAYENYDAGETTTHPPSSFAPKDGTP